MPTIRVDADVYRWLQELATPFLDTPNSVLRRLAGLQGVVAHAVPAGGERVTGEHLARAWSVEVAHALYHREGRFYENLRAFPGGLFDPSGYVVFESKAAYEAERGLRIGQKLNVPGGIRSLPGYVAVRDGGSDQ